MSDLTPDQLSHHEEAWKSLRLAESLFGQRRIARGQEVLREAQASFYQLPRQFTDADFEVQYERLYNQLYRGF